MYPVLPDLPAFQSTAVPRSNDVNTKLLALPGMVNVNETDARAREAEKYANDIRAAFYHTKESLKRSNAIAKARGRQAQRMAERR